MRLKPVYAAFCCLFTGLIAGPWIGLAQTPSVNITPASQQVRVDSLISSSVQVQNVPSLHGYSVTVVYDTALLKYHSARKGSFLSPSLFFVTPDTLKGQIIIDEALLGTGGSSGAGILIELQFSPRKPGLANITIDRVVLRDPANQDIPATSTSGTVLITATTGIPGDNSPAKTFRLYQNFPNPFNSSTTITYSLQIAGPVEITISDIAGKRVVTLVREQQEIGSHVVRWDGMDDGQDHVCSGVYFAVMRFGAFVDVRPMLLVR